MSDNVNHPNHYEKSTSLECIEAMQIGFGREAVLHFCLCNAFKYIWRWKYKNGEEDLNKANWYIDYAVDLINDPETSPALGTYTKKFIEMQLYILMKKCDEN